MPRGNQRHLRARRSGVAILSVVVVTLAILTVLITEMIYTATVRLTVALHQKERVQAQWVAHSGFNLYRLILVASKDLERNESLQNLAEQAGFNLSAFPLWEEIPMLETSLMRMQLSRFIGHCF